MRMTAIDRWATQAPRDIAGAETYEGWTHDEHFAMFSATCAKFFGDRVDIRRMDTKAAAPLIADESLDFVFIDADHTYEGCLADINLWTPKVRPGGMVSGHDMDWPTVRRAVEDTGPFMVSSDNVWLRFKGASV